MDASSFRSTGIKMTIDNPDDFCSFKGKDIDFEDEKYDPFPVYRFKPVAMNMLKHCIVPSRLDNLVANLEYIGSRKMANVEELELAESTLSFFTNEFPRYWLKKGSEALLTSVPEILVSMQDPKPVGGESPLSIPFLTESIRGDEGKVAILVAPQCFEKNPDFPDKQMLNYPTRKAESSTKTAFYFACPSAGFVLLTIAVLIPWMLSPPIARVLWIGVRP